MKRIFGVLILTAIFLALFVVSALDVGVIAAAISFAISLLIIGLVMFAAYLIAED
ncbi:MAG: hypothetical protein WC322_02765 [Candidatus Paceibacterota bacterium]|jgi:hypothetical protein